ncbi:MAG: hypothetical protein ACK4TB_13575 [Gemmobacter sp.]
MPTVMVAGRWSGRRAMAGPLCNRVMPDGSIAADPARGLFTGNRGSLHDGTGRIVRGWTTRAWVTCRLVWKGRRRDPMPPGRWTALFFLDEAVALAAGHRPCGACRRGDYLAFRAAWAGAHGAAPLGHDDGLLHAARRAGPYGALADALPDGTFVMIGVQPHLVLGDSLRPFAPSGYGTPVPRPAGPVAVLTPAPTLAALAAGYRPVLHPSARDTAAPAAGGRG